jgi:hypothetical protein
MAVKLIDLRIIYGIAGAPERFEELVTMLVKGEYPSATKVRTDRGDGGIDVYVGEFTAPEGIDVYQAKYFVEEIGESQKDQIRGSFTRIQRNSEFKAKSWTLCLPINMSPKEAKWFEGWKAKQTGIDIRQPWDQTKLESLLLDSKNRGVKEELFKEEHLTQIREMHGMMQSLINRIEELVREVSAEQKQMKRTEALARQAEYIDQFVRSLRDHYLELIGQGAGDPRVQDKQPARWEVVIHPSPILDHSRIGSLADCWSIVRVCQIGPVHWQYPEVSSARSGAGPDWIAGTWANHRGDIGCWRLSSSGVFANMVIIPDYPQVQPTSSGSFLDVGETLGRLMQIFRFAKNLAERAYDPGDGTVEIAICLTGIQGYQLAFRDGFLRPSCCADVPELKKTWRCPRKELGSAPDDFALSAARWFFEGFNWIPLSESELTRIQAQYSPHFVK